MKKILLPFLFSILFFNFLFAQKTMDKNLVGFWSSTIYPTKNDPVKGNAFIDRKADGTFTLFLEVNYNNDSIYAKEVGHWYTKDDIYTEIGEEYNNGYSYKINQNQVNFKVKNKKYPLGFRLEKFVEQKTKDLTDYYEDKYSIFMVKSMKKMLDMNDRINGFSYDQTDGVQDVRFVGVWKGSEKDNQVKGLSKEWTMTRNADGTFIINFSIKSKNLDDKNFVQKGKWWIKGEKLYQYNEVTKMTNVYNFEILNENQIRFIENVIYFNYQEYNIEFIERKVK